MPKPPPSSGSPDLTSNFQHLACLTYHPHDSPTRREQARLLLDAHPELATGDIYSACCVGDPEAVRRFLDDDPSRGNRRGGFFDWEPLLYACYARLDLPGRSTLEVARLLLERGADANAHYMWGGQYRFTALTGAFGEGEMGPKNQPPHAQCEALARLLLEAGAYPNDSQALYNRMFNSDNTCLELLLEYGLNDRDRCNWLVQGARGLQPNPQQTLQYQLAWAVKNHHAARARLLVEHGADLSTPSGGTSFFEMAMRSGDPDLAEFLVAHGASRVELDSLAHFACACMSGNRVRARELLDVEPDLMERLQTFKTGLLHDAASANKLEAVRVLADLGADLDKQSHNAPLHEAAWAGHLEMVRLLIDKGANPWLRDRAHGGTPLMWAHVSGKQEVFDYLASLDLDIFDALFCNQIGRVTGLLEANAGWLDITLKELRGGDHGHDDDWMTPLAYSVTKRKPEMVRLMLDRGANPDLRDPLGRSLLDIARRDSIQEVVTILELGKGA